MNVLKNNIPVLYAIAAAVFYGVSIPLSKLLLESVPPVFTAALLYLGAGFGMLLFQWFRKENVQQKEAKISKSDLPFVAAMTVLDIAAPICLMTGLTLTTSSTASLLNNFEIVVTAIIARLVFQETIGKRTWTALVIITCSTVLLTVENFSSFSFSSGSLLVLLATLCWGMENNCTGKLSLKNPLQIVIIKGLGSGFGTLLIALFLGQYVISITLIAMVLLLGFVSFGMSIYCYIMAQRNLGAARTGAYYALAPFAGVGLSFTILREQPTISFGIALLLMIIGVYLIAFERHAHLHTHSETGHEHRHSHDDLHHSHLHNPLLIGEHSHFHTHEILEHKHSHTPDIHHKH